MGKKKQDKLIDVLGKELVYAVLAKKGRIQVLIRPTDKGLRKRAKRGWDLLSAVDSEQQNPRHLLDQAFQEALAAVDPAPSKKKK